MIHNRPPQGATLDRSHPLTRGLVVALPLNEPGATTFRNLADDRPWTTDAALFWSRDRVGMRGTGTFDQSLITGSTPDIGAEYTIEFGLIRTANADAQVIRSSTSATVWIDWNSGLSSDDYYGVGLSVVAMEVTRNRWQQIIERGGPTGCDVWQDGIRLATTGTPPGTLGAIQTLGAIVGSARLFNDVLGWVRVWNRRLSDAELDSIDGGRWPNLSRSRATVIADLLPSIIAASHQPSHAAATVYQLGTAPIGAASLAPADSAAILSVESQIIAAGPAPSMAKATGKATIHFTAAGQSPIGAGAATVSLGPMRATGRQPSHGRATLTNTVSGTARALAPSHSRAIPGATVGAITARSLAPGNSQANTTNAPAVVALGHAPANSRATSTQTVSFVANGLTPADARSTVGLPASVIAKGESPSTARTTLTNTPAIVARGLAPSQGVADPVTRLPIVARGPAPSSSRSYADASFVAPFRWPHAVAVARPLRCFALPVSTVS